MKKLKFTSQLHFDRGQRVGILFLLAVIIALLYVYFWAFSSSESIQLDISSAEIIRLQKKVDSLRLAEIERRKPKIYPFNPNFITDHKAYVLGMSPLEFDRLRAFRQQDRWINSKQDFKKVTKVSDSLLECMAVNFKFPNWITNPKPKTSYARIDQSPRKFSERMELNDATVLQLQKVRGIGPALSERIVRKRDQLNGFKNNAQLFDVWGLKPEVIDRVLDQFEVKTPEVISKYNVNTASASDLATIPGVSFLLGKKIWEFVKLRDGVADISELEKIEEITPRKFQLIELYLYAE